MNSITFNNVCTTSLNPPIVVENPPDYSYPEMDYTLTHIPGRNGDSFFNVGSYKNVEMQYKIAIGKDGVNFDTLAESMTMWLRSAKGYARLHDTFGPDIRQEMESDVYVPKYYRMAVSPDAGTVTNVLWHAGRATVKFKCKPQKFLTLGDEVIQIITDENGDGSAVITNPTQFESKPIIHVTTSGVDPGSCTLTINGVVVSLLSTYPGGYTTIDSELEDVYATSVSHPAAINWNQYAVLYNYTFPTLKPGDNSIVFNGEAGKIVDVEVIPRWWTL
jgi:phage-related protein